MSDNRLNEFRSVIAYFCTLALLLQSVFILDYRLSRDGLDMLNFHNYQLKNDFISKLLPFGYT